MLSSQWRGSLTTRVTVIATTATALVMGLLLAGVLVGVTSQLRATTEAGLQARSSDLQAALAGGAEQVLSVEPYAQLGSGRTVRLSPTLGGTLLVPADTPVRDPVLVDRDLPGPDGERLRVLARLLPDGRLLAVGVSREGPNEAGERLLTALAVAGPLLLLMVAAVVARSVQAALRPVDEMVRQVDQITAAEDTGRRLPPVTGDDELAHLSRTLDAMLARLATAFDRERSFVDDASHELRTPVAVLRGELELALSDLDDAPGVERSLRAALGEAERLTRLADDLLLLARDRTGALALHRDELDLPDLLARTADRLRVASGLLLTVDSPPLLLLGDQGRLEQVLANLVGNAAAAGATAAVLVAEQRGQHVLLGVEDDGPGFPAGFRDLAFERFTRADPARTRGTGAGLGLALVAAVARAAGGTVRASDESRLGGAAVHLLLPVSPP